MVFRGTLLMQLRDSKEFQLVRKHFGTAFAMREKKFVLALQKFVAELSGPPTLQQPQKSTEPLSDSVPSVQGSAESSPTVLLEKPEESKEKGPDPITETGPVECNLEELGDIEDLDERLPEGQ